MTANRTKPTTNTSARAKSDGFTVVEVVATTVVLSVFLLLFFNGYFALESQRVTVARQATASDIAYSNLRKVTSRPASLTQSVCTSNAASMDLTTGNPSTEPGLDLTAYGYTLEPNSNVTQALGSTATQKLVAYAPAGCANWDSSPMKVVSSVSYGTNGEKATHANFIQ